MTADPDAVSSEPPAPAPPSLPIGKVVLALAIQAIVMVAVGYGLWVWSGRAGAGFVDWSGSQALVGLALGAGLVALAWTLFRGLPTLGERLVRMQARTYGFIGGQLGLPAIAFISLCAGVGEEALFRGGLQTFLGDYVGAPAAIALSSAAFAAIHLAQPVITVMLFLIGVLFGTVYWQTGSLLAVMIGHALYDVWALRYLLQEFVRLGLVGEPLVKPAPEG